MSDTLLTWRTLSRILSPPLFLCQGLFQEHVQDYPKVLNLDPTQWDVIAQSSDFKGKVPFVSVACFCIKQEASLLFVTQCVLKSYEVIQENLLSVPKTVAVLQLVEAYS